MKNKLKFIIYYILVLFLIAYIYFNFSDNSTKTDNNNLIVSYIDVGQGNGVLIQNGKENIVIDGGDKSNSDKFVSFLKSRKVSNIKYMVASHYDSDHISGLIEAMDQFNIENIINPGYSKDSQTYKDFVKKRKSTNAKIIVPNIHDEFYVDDLKIKVVGPTSYDMSEENDRSIVLKLTYGNTSFLFPGDAAKQSESSMIYTGENLKSDVLMLGHHGSKYSTNDFFLDEVNPKIAIISVGENNRYNHPSKAVLSKLKSRNIQVFRTDKDGDIILESDGKNIRKIE